MGYMGILFSMPNPMPYSIYLRGTMRSAVRSNAGIQYGRRKHRSKVKLRFAPLFRRHLAMWVFVEIRVDAALCAAAVLSLLKGFRRHGTLRNSPYRLRKIRRSYPYRLRKRHLTVICTHTHTHTHTHMSHNR